MAAYLIEALVRERGFLGLREGFRLVQELIEQYWDGLFPLQDADGPTARIIHISGLNGVDGEGTLIRPILAIPITAGETVSPFSCADIKQAQQLAALPPAEQQRRIAEGASSVAMLEQAIAETPRAFFVARLGEIQLCLDEYDRMCATIDAKCGGKSSYTSNIRNTLETVAESIRYIAGDLKVPEETLPSGLVSEQTPGSEPTCQPTAGARDGHF